MSAERPLPFDLSGRADVALTEVVDHAARLTRVDRKYLISREVAEKFLAALPDGFRVLTIDGRRSTSYSSVYFDTPQLDACRDHVQQRRRRWKVRSRLYVQDRLCRIEVKTKDRRGLTAKAVAASDPSRHGVLTGPEADFVEEVLGERGIDLDVRTLRPTMEVRYERVTLADTEQSQRVTLDRDIACTLEGGRVWMDENWVLVETKGELRPSEADRGLAALGARPRSFSKYVSAASLLSPHIADNDVRGLHGRQLHATIDDAVELSA